MDMWKCMRKVITVMFGPDSHRGARRSNQQNYWYANLFEWCGKLDLNNFYLLPFQRGNRTGLADTRWYGPFKSLVFDSISICDEKRDFFSSIHWAKGGQMHKLIRVADTDNDGDDISLTQNYHFVSLDSTRLIDLSVVSIHQILYIIHTMFK